MSLINFLTTCTNLTSACSQHGSFFTCKVPDSSTWIQYTLDSILARSSLSNVLFISQRQTQTQITIGFGYNRIGPPNGQYRYDIGGVAFYADDNEVPTRQDLTWNELLRAIELLQYCITGEGIYKEIEAKLYVGSRQAGKIQVKRVEENQYSAQHIEKTN